MCIHLCPSPLPTRACAHTHAHGLSPSSAFHDTFLLLQVDFGTTGFSTGIDVDEESYQGILDIAYGAGFSKLGSLCVLAAHMPYGRCMYCMSVEHSCCDQP